MNLVQQCFKALFLHDIYIQGNKERRGRSGRLGICIIFILGSPTACLADTSVVS